MRLYNAQSRTPMMAGPNHVAPKASPPPRDVPSQSPTAFGRKWRRPSSRSMPTDNADPLRQVEKTMSTCFDPFELENPSSHEPIAKNSCSRSNGTSVTEKLTPVVSSESRDLFAVSDETDEFLAFPDPFAPSHGDFQSPMEGDYPFNDASTWMTSSTLSTKFTNHELNVDKTFRRDGTNTTTFAHQPVAFPPAAHNRRPDEVIVRTAQTPPCHSAATGTSESFPLAPTSEGQWWNPTTDKSEPFDPFASNSTLPAFPADKNQDSSNELMDKENQPIEYLPQQYATAKAKLRPVPRKVVVFPPNDLSSFAAKEERRSVYQRSYKKKEEAPNLASLQQAKPLLSSRPEESKLGRAKEYGRTQSDASAAAAGRTTTFIKKYVTSGASNCQIQLPHLPANGSVFNQALSHEKRGPQSTPVHDPSSIHRTGVVSSDLALARARLGKTTSKTVVKESTNKAVASASSEVVPSVNQHKETSSSADALTLTRARLGKATSQECKVNTAGAPGSFLAERIEAVRPAAIVCSQDDASPPRGTKAGCEKGSSPIVTNAKRISQGKSLQNMPSLRLDRNKVNQTDDANLPDSTSSSNACEKTASQATETDPDESYGMIPLKEDPKFAKYFKMLKTGLPKGAVKQAMERDGLDSSVLDGDHNAPAGRKPCEGVPLKDDQKYSKYFKMLKMGLPMGAVKQAMERDGLESSVLDGDRNAPAGQKPSEAVAVEDDPKYAKYMKMLKMGLPIGAVKQAMERDGLDSSILDGDLSSPFGGAKDSKGVAGNMPVPRDKYRRTRVHWETHTTVRSNTVWAMVRRDPDVAELNVDDEEFSNLFQAESKPKPSQKLAAQSSIEKGVVKVIDSKRANNGGITLARIKLTYEEVASAVDCYDETAFSQEQIRGILQYLPTADETTALRNYLDGGSNMEGLCECEKFMVAMMTVKHAKRKLDAILYIQKFASSLEEIRRDARLVQKACDEVMASSRFRKIIGIVLHLGNRLNTAGPVTKEPAGAIKLESLLKLNQPRAFDKKTSFLQYVVRVVRRNNASLCHFKDDLSAVLVAEKIVWESTLVELKRMESELESVRRLALYHALGRERSQASTRGPTNDSVAGMNIPSKISVDEEVSLLRKTSIGEFTLDACSRMAAVVEEITNAKTSYHALLLYFGEEDDTTAQPNDVFRTISTFSKDFEAAMAVAVEAEKAQAKEAKRRSRKLMASSPPPVLDGSEGESQSSGSPPLPKRTTSGVGGVLDELRSKPNLKWRRRKHVP